MSGGGGGFAAPDLFAHDFNDGTWGGLNTIESTSGWNYPGSQSVVNAGVAPGSTSRTLQKDWNRAHFGGVGNDDSGVVYTPDFAAVAELYVRYRCYFEAAFATGASNYIMKQVRFHSAGMGNLWGTFDIYSGDQFIWLWDQNQTTYDTPVTFNGDGTVFAPSQMAGRWTTIEVYNRMVANQYRAIIWIDGDMQIDTARDARADANGWMTSALGAELGADQTVRSVSIWNTFNGGPYAGKSWIDDVAVSTQRIGV